MKLFVDVSLSKLAFELPKLGAALPERNIDRGQLDGRVGRGLGLYSRYLPNFFVKKLPFLNLTSVSAISSRSKANNKCRPILVQDLRLDF